MHPVRHIAFTNELRFARPREEVFEAFLETEKWFQVSYGEERLKQVVNDRRVGGQIYEDWGGGTGKLYGTIGWWDPPAPASPDESDAGRRDHAHPPLRVRGRTQGTVLRHEFSAFGPISDEMAEGIEWHGSLETFEQQLRAWIERGEVIPPPGD
jgi:hypothetical protein